MIKSEEFNKKLELVRGVIDHVELYRGGSFVSSIDKGLLGKVEFCEIGGGISHVKFNLEQVVVVWVDDIKIVL